MKKFENDFLMKKSQRLNKNNELKNRKLDENDELRNRELD
jgi:hypothetical protein